MARECSLKKKSGTSIGSQRRVFQLSIVSNNCSKHWSWNNSNFVTTYDFIGQEFQVELGSVTRLFHVLLIEFTPWYLVGRWTCLEGLMLPFTSSVFVAGGWKAPVFNLFHVTTSEFPYDFSALKMWVFQETADDAKPHNPDSTVIVLVVSSSHKPTQKERR